MRRVPRLRQRFTGGRGGAGGEGLALPRQRLLYKKKLRILALG